MASSRLSRLPWALKSPTADHLSTRYQQIRRPRRFIHSERPNQYSSSIKNIGEKIRARYPDLSARHIPSVTLSFLILHELTAIVPLAGSFAILHTSGTGQKIYDWIRTVIINPEDTYDSGRILNAFRSTVSEGLDEGSRKLSRLSIKYGWANIPENISISDNDEALDQVSLLDGSIMSSGLVAYLIVKAVLPLRVGLSLYLAPICARAAHRILRPSIKT